MTEDWHDRVTEKQVREKYSGRNLFTLNRTLFARQVWNSPQVLADIVLYMVIGQLPHIKNIRFNILDREYDLRSHAAIFLPSGSGKGGLFNYLGMLTTMVNLDYYPMGELTDAALLGTWELEEFWDKKDEVLKHEKKLTPGALDVKSGHNIIAFNEADPLFNSPNSTWAKNSMTWFQKTMNPFGTPDNLITKDTSKGRIEFQSDVSMFFNAKLPEKFYQVLTTMGFLQRCLLMNIPKSWQKKKEDDKFMMEGVGDKNTKEKQKTLLVADALQFIDQYFSDVKELEFSPEAKKMLSTTAHQKIHAPLEGMAPYTQEVLQTFCSRYQEFIVRASYHNAITRLSTQIEVEDVSHAIVFIMPLWKNIVHFIEDGLKVSEPDRLEGRRRTALMDKIYDYLCKKLTDKSKKEIKYIPFNMLVKVLKSREYGWNVSDETARKRILSLVNEGQYSIKDESGVIYIKRKILDLNIGDFTETDDNGTGNNDYDSIDFSR